MRITEFTMVTPQQFEDAYKDLQEKGMEKLIVDLRDNPGGVLSSVCDVLRQYFARRTDRVYRGQIWGKTGDEV